MQRRWLATRALLPKLLRSQDALAVNLRFAAQQEDWLLGGNCENADPSLMW